MMRYLPLVILIQALWGCCSPQPIFQTSVVSMKSANFDKLKAGDSVKEQWCTGDPVVTGSDDTVGSMDQVIAKAQKKAKADAILDAQFYVSCSCMQLKGTAAFAGKGAGGGGKGGGGKKKTKKKGKRRASNDEMDGEDEDGPPDEADAGGFRFEDYVWTH
jgi:hypothetical protein